jgi:hypothetical protein
MTHSILLRRVGIALFGVTMLGSTALAQGKSGKSEEKKAAAAGKTVSGKKVVVTQPPKTVIVKGPAKPKVVTSGGDVTPPGHLKKELGLKSASSVAPGHTKRHVTMIQGVNATRTVLQRNGYEVIRVLPYNGTEIVYYRNGPTGTLQRIVVVPDGEVVGFRYAPQSLLSLILAQLGM